MHLAPDHCVVAAPIRHRLLFHKTLLLYIKIIKTTKKHMIFAYEMTRSAVWIFWKSPSGA